MIEYIFCKKIGNIFKFRVDTLEHLHTKYFSLNLMSNTTNVVSSNPTHGEVCLTCYVIKFVIT